MVGRLNIVASKGDLVRGRLLPFKTTSNYYLYSGSINKYSKIDELDYLKIIDGDISMTHENFPNIAEEFFKHTEVVTFEHPESQNLEDYKNRKLKHLIIQVTQDCNLRCSYCSFTQSDGTYRNHSKKRQNIENVYRALEQLYANSIDNDELIIGFYGGEPLLEFDMIKKIVGMTRAEFAGKKVRFHVTTNGTLLTNDIIQFFSSNNFTMTISIDGPKAINDANRVFADGSASVFDTIIGHILVIHSQHKEFQKSVSINMVLDSSRKISDYKNFFVDYPQLNEFIVRCGYANEDYSATLKIVHESLMSDGNYMKFLYYLKYMNEIRFDSKFHSCLMHDAVSGAFKPITNTLPLDQTDCPSGPCIPGKSRYFMGTDGRYFPCERVSDRIEENVIGSVETGLELKRMEKMMNVSANIAEECQSCFAFRHCKLCIRSHENPLVREKKCKVERELFRSELISKAYISEIRSMRK